MSSDLGSLGAERSGIRRITFLHGFQFISVSFRNFQTCKLNITLSGSAQLISENFRKFHSGEFGLGKVYFFNRRDDSKNDDYIRVYKVPELFRRIQNGRSKKKLLEHAEKVLTQNRCSIIIHISWSQALLRWIFCRRKNPKGSCAFTLQGGEREMIHLPRSWIDEIRIADLTKRE